MYKSLDVLYQRNLFLITLNPEMSKIKRPKDCVFGFW